MESPPSPRSRPSKRTHSPSPSSSSTDDDNCSMPSLECPVCFCAIRDAHVTVCGHTFCYGCLKKSIETSRACPQCSRPLTTSEIFPNHTVDRLMAGMKATPRKRRLGTSPIAQSISTDELSQRSIVDIDNLDIKGIDNMMARLQQKKCELQSTDQQVRKHLINKFLHRLKDRKRHQIVEIEEELVKIDADLRLVGDVPTASEGSVPEIKSECASPTFEIPSVRSNDIAENDSELPTVASLVEEKYSRLEPYIGELEAHYYSLRNSASDGEEALNSVAHTMSRMTRYSQLRSIARFYYSSDSHVSTIVSGVDFDKDNEFFATAGVCKRIKIYDYYAIIDEAARSRAAMLDGLAHSDDCSNYVFPTAEMAAPHKLSCVSWSPYIKQHLVSCDYEGHVNLWDVNSGEKVQVFLEHQKRCWSVDFNRQNPKIFASASDDHKVKIWSTERERSIGSLETSANVCAVSWNPVQGQYFVCGCADHSIYYGDSRNPKQALACMKGHRKAVSYTKFVDSKTIVSASTDSSLRLWQIEAKERNRFQTECKSIFKGHVNEKNFVGLATNGELIACGSETNCLYVYHRDIPRTLFASKLSTSSDGRSSVDVESGSTTGSAGNAANGTSSAGNNEFVSAVCWKSDADVVVAANSTGVVKIFELTHS